MGELAGTPLAVETTLLHRGEGRAGAATGSGGQPGEEGLGTALAQGQVLLLLCWNAVNTFTHEH